MAKKKPAEPKVTDIVYRDREDGKVDKVWLNGKKIVRVEVVAER